MLIRLSAAIALALIIFTSCGMDPDNLYGKRKEFQILDEHGKSMVLSSEMFVRVRIVEHLWRIPPTVVRSAAWHYDVV